jgi:hypothetical protein
MSSRDSGAMSTPLPTRHRRVWPWMAAIACALVGWYLWRAASLWFARPVIAFDLVDEINARQPKPGPEGSAFPVYAEAFAGKIETSRLWNTRIAEGLALAGVDADALANLRRDLDAVEPQIAVLRRLSAHPVLGAPAFRDASEQPQIAALMGQAVDVGSEAKWPADSFMRGALAIGAPLVNLSAVASSLLRADAAVAALDGDIDRAIESLDAATVAAAHIGESAFFSNAMVMAWAESAIASSILSLVENHADQLDEAQLEALEAIVRRLARDGGERCIDIERLALLDAVQRIYSDDGAGDGELLPRAMKDFEYATTPLTANGKPKPGSPRQLSDPVRFLVAPIANRLRDGRAATVTLVDRIASLNRELLETPSGRAVQTRMERLDFTVDSAARGEQPVVSAMGISWRGLHWHVRKARLSRDAALAAIGIERFRRANARFPASLEELAAFTGVALGADNPPSNPWRYAIVEGRPLIYDFGSDGIDDGARPAAATVSEIRGYDASLKWQGARSSTSASLRGDFDPREEIDPAMQAPGVVPLSPMPGELADRALRTVTATKPRNEAWRDGDAIWVLWRSGAIGPSRVVRLKPENGEFRDPATE